MEQEVPNEFLLVLDDGEVDIKDFIPDGEILPSQPRPKGAYYKNIERKMLLKKKRINVRISHVFYVLDPECSRAVIRPGHEEVAHDQGAAYEDGRRRSEGA